MKNILQAPAQIESVATLKDGTIKLSVYTQELPPEEMTALFGLTRKMGWFMFAENTGELNEIDIPKDNAETGIKKSDSQVLRSVIYLCGEKLGKKDSDDYYHKQMRWIIDLYKEKLNE